jgi:signal transduction histidine kinase
MSAMPDDEQSRVVRFGGLVVWLMVGIPIALEGSVDRGRLLAWAVAYVAFAAALWRVTSGTRSLVWPALETAAVLAMVLLLCNGFEGSLLVLVALQLGGLVSARSGAIWILSANALLGAAIGVHWSLRPAVLLVPPYLGFQILAFFVASLLARVARGRALAEENSRLEERLRIARDLHDAVGHRLTALRLNLEAAARTVQGDTREPVLAAQSLARQTLQDIRAAVAELRDDGRVDLGDALATLAADIPRPRVHVDVPPDVTRDPASALVLLRCAQEIITNAARHSAAENLWIRVSKNGSLLELSARDDGIGAEALVPGGGLRGMRERVEGAGGGLEVGTQRRGGFFVRARLPVRPTKEAPT